MKEYAERRQKLMDRMGPDAVAVIPSALRRKHSADVMWPYRQNSDFLYLTGFREPHAVAVLMPGHSEHEFVLFCEERNPEKERWEGPTAGVQGACTQYGAQAAWPISALRERLPELLRQRQTLYYALGADTEFDEVILKSVDNLRNSRGGIEPPHDCRLLDAELHEMRLFKSEEELECMRRAAQVAAKAHCRAMRLARPGCYEYELEAELLHVMHRHNLKYAYSAIVASGPNACVLHYEKNARRIEAGDLVLIDAGGMYADYASDITRTWPVSGEFSEPQREIYELVLEAQQAAIRQCVPGNPVTAIHEEATQVLTRGLVDLGVLQGEWRKLWEDQAYRPFYMHQTGHWLGMDVHDAGTYVTEGQSRLLQANMVTTIEPGLYFPPDLKEAPERFRGIGVRIEDDVAVTADQPEVLSAGVPKDPDEMCRLIGTEAKEHV